MLLHWVWKLLLKFVLWKKGQKQEQQIDTPIENKKNNFENIEIEDDDDEDWFTVKEKPEALEQAIIDLPNPSGKEKKITKAKLAKKLRKKNLLINKRVAYDDEGNVIVHSDEEDQSATYNIEDAKVRLQQMDKTDKEAYRAIVKQKHQERRMREKEARRAAREAKRRKEAEESDEEENEEESPPNEQPVVERKRSLSPDEPAIEIKKKKNKKQRSLAEFTNEDNTKSINDTEQLALYLLSK